MIFNKLKLFVKLLVKRNTIFVINEKKFKGKIEKQISRLTVRKGKIRKLIIKTKILFSTNTFIIYRF